MDELDNNSNIVLDGATVTLTNSDLEANGDITIKDEVLAIIKEIFEEIPKKTLVGTFRE